MPALLINGVDAEATYGFTLAEAPGWSDMPSRQVQSAPIIGRQGVKELADPQEQPRKLSLRGMVRGTSIADARAKLDALKLAMAAKPAQFTFADQPTRFVSGRLDSFTCQALTGSMVHGAMPVDASFVCSDPYFYDALLAGVFINYSPGDTITGEVFTGPAGRYFIDANGVLQTAGLNVKRDSHYIGGVRTLLLEGLGKNLCINSENMGAASWALDGGASRTAGQASPDGGANAYLITAPGALAGIEESPAFTGNAEKVAGRCFKAGSAGTVLFGIFDATAAVYRHQARITWTAGVPAVTTAQGAGTRFTPVPLTNGWYWIAISALGVLAANSNRVVALTEAAGTFLMFGAQDEDSTFPTSYMKTTGATFTRTAETLSVPHYAPPQEMSVYTSHIELGTELGANITGLYDLGGGIPNLIVYRNATPGLQSGLTTAAGGVVSPLIGATAAIGDLVETVQGLAADGSTSSTKTLNNGAESAPVASAALALPPAWATPAFYPNGDGSFVNRGFTAFRSIKLAARIRTRDELRALPKMPLGTGVVRPLVRINGASNNPVITLYNKAGVAVGSIALTITTIAGDILEVDMDAKTVKKNGVSSIASITAGDFFSVDPADQTNFGAPGPSINSSSGAITVEYRKVWR